MDFSTFIEGPILKIIFGIFCIVVFARIVFFVLSIIKGSIVSDLKFKYIFTNIIRAFIPFHRAIPKKPIYSSLRYIFHFCLFVVPIWLAGHISLWEDSSLEWSWYSIPDEWADWMTLLLLLLAVIFILRHIIIKDIRINSSIRDFIIIIIAALPFMTGYFLAHGTLDQIPFFESNMWTIHIMSGELMILTAAFLFCRTRMNSLVCTGCASCVSSCPTNTLEYKEVGNQRIFNYSHYQCICCASCVNTCPENAAELRHEISPINFIQIFAKPEIRSVELESCVKCGALYVPEPLMGKIKKTFTNEYLDFCPDCRKINIGDYLKKLSPWHNKNKLHA